MLGFADGTTIAIIVVVALLVILLITVPLWVMLSYNKFIKLRNNVDEAFSTMDVQMKKRYDLIPNLVETVKGYATHENSTLENVMKARYAAMNSSTVEQRIDNENILQGALKSLFAVSENYPNLQANQNFLDLQQTLKTLEEEIAASRRFYNGNVKAYNVMRESFPSNLIAGIFRFEKKALFEVSAEEERVAPKVEF